jgi:hypothetical protein
MSVFLPKNSESKNRYNTLSATSPMDASWMKGGNPPEEPVNVKDDINNLLAQAQALNVRDEQSGGAKKVNKKGSKKGSRKLVSYDNFVMEGGKKKKQGSSKKVEKKMSKKASKKSRHSKKMAKGGGRNLPPALVAYQAIVKKVKADMEKNGIELKGITLINSYVGAMNKSAKSAGVTDTDKYIMDKYESDKKSGKLKSILADLEKASLAKKAAKKAAKKEAKLSTSSDS